MIPVKTTMKALLINLTDKQEALIDNLMLVFCTAIRYSFKRQLEGQRIGDLEKVVAQERIPTLMVLDSLRLADKGTTKDTPT